MGKPTICIGENKGADQLRGYRKADQRLCFFTTRIVQFLFYLNLKFQASSSFLCLYRPVCVRPGRKPQCWFSHEAAQMLVHLCTFEYSILLMSFYSIKNMCTLTIILPLTWKIFYINILKVK